MTWFLWFVWCVYCCMLNCGILLFGFYCYRSCFTLLTWDYACCWLSFACFLVTTFMLFSVHWWTLLVGCLFGMIWIGGWHWWCFVFNELVLRDVLLVGNCDPGFVGVFTCFWFIVATLDWFGFRVWLLLFCFFSLGCICWLRALYLCILVVCGLLAALLRLLPFENVGTSWLT